MSIEPITIPMSIEANDVTIDSTFDARIEVVEGGSVTVQSLTVLSNGTTVAPEGKAYSPVIVNVPNTYSNSDEGKVVKNGALTSQTTTTVNTNGNVDTTTIKKVTVSVPASAVDTGTKNINTNGTHDVVGYASASVSVPASAVDSGTKSITSNGNNQDVVGYAKVNVNVPNSYSAGDEGKVVSSGALVSQTSDTVTTNDTYDTTLINSLTVNVSGGGGITITPMDYSVTVKNTASGTKAFRFLEYNSTTLFNITDSNIAGQSTVTKSSMATDGTHFWVRAAGANSVSYNGAACTYTKANSVFEIEIPDNYDGTYTFNFNF